MMKLQTERMTTMSDEEKIKEPTETTEAPNKNMDIDVEISEDGSGELQEKNRRAYFSACRSKRQISETLCGI